MTIRTKLALFALAALPILLSPFGSTPTSPTFKFTMAASDHVDVVAAWMVRNIAAKAIGMAATVEATRDDALSYFRLVARLEGMSRSTWSGGPGTAPVASANDLSALQEEVSRLGPTVERMIQVEIGEELAAQGMDSHLGSLDLLFPPVLFRFEPLPKLLVVSPRSRIDRTSAVLLDPNLALREAETLENSVARQGFSGVVVQIGGLGVYPSMVPESPNVRGTLRTVAHEWTHQFLALRPLGWRYAFGTETDSRMVTINETAAETVGDEIGDAVYAREYGAPGEKAPDPSGRDATFKRALRDIRAHVEPLLTAGRIDEAEAYMDESRRGLAGQGFFVRKLNQAYLAFYGGYAAEPSATTGVNRDISERIQRLRRSSTSLGDFLRRVASVGSYDDLLRLTP